MGVEVERDALADMAMAHLRLAQSLRSLSMSSPAWNATTDALVALAEAIGGPAAPVVTGVELHCDDCQQPYGVWFADNEVWNLVMGGPEAKGDPGGMLCPRCFTVRAEATYKQGAIWRLVLDNATSLTPPADPREQGGER